jgi:cytidylate kinase
MIISISGPPGSGKTSVAKIVASRYSLELLSAGAIFREMASKANTDVVSMNRRAERVFDVDKLVDQTVAKRAARGNIVVESHINSWLLAGIADILVYLNAPLQERANRIAKRDGISYPEALRQIVERENSHYKRFKRYYGIDITDLRSFDLTVNTAKVSPTAVADMIDRLVEEIKHKRS